MTEPTRRRQSLDCPRCGKPVQAAQDWCLSCGAAARTRLLRSPNWRRPLAVLAILAALSLVAFAVSFVDLTEDPTPPKVTPVNTIKTVTVPAPAPPAAP